MLSNILLITRHHMALVAKKKTKALIRLCVCTSWSVHLMFSNPQNRFSHVKAYMPNVLVVWFSHKI